MLKRIGSVVAMAIVGLVVAAGSAIAAPIYAPPGLSAVYIGNDQIVITGTNYGNEDGPDGTVVITVGYGTPSGLRASAGLSAAASATFTVNPNSDGNFSATATLSQTGEVWVRGVGQQSGDDVTVSLYVPAKSGSGSGGGGSGSGGAGSNQNYSSGYASGDVSSGYAGLASTGASIGGPLAIGIGALLAGLTLLFFGTRGVMRRKGVKSGASG